MQYNGSVQQKITLNQLLSSPKFYLAALPHVVTAWIVLRGDLGYAFIFFIFYTELVIDYLVYILDLFLMKPQDLRNLYKIQASKFYIIIRSFVLGLLLIGSLGILPFMVFMLTDDGTVLITDIVVNAGVWSIIGLYTLIKLTNFIINKYQQSLGKISQIDMVKSLGINLVTLIVFVGLFLPLMFVLGVIENIIFDFSTDFVQLIALILFFGLKAYIDGALSIQEVKK